METTGRHITTHARLSMPAALLAVAFLLALSAGIAGCGQEPESPSPPASMASNATVVSVNGQVALVEADPGGNDFGIGGQAQAANPYPSLMAGDRVTVQWRMISSDENRIVGCERKAAGDSPGMPPRP